MSNMALPVSPIGQAIAADCCCHCQSSVAQIQQAVIEIRALDALSERKQQQGCIGAAVGMLGILIGTFTAAIADIPVLMLFSLLSLIGVIVAVSIRIRHGKTNFDNRRYELLAQVAQLLAKDMGSAGLFDVSLNLLPQDHKSKFVRDGKSGAWSVKHYYDPWLALEGRFLDGTKFSLHMAEKHQARSKRKRSSRGKIKFKSKSKQSSEITLHLKVKPEKHPALETLRESAAGALKLPLWAHTKDIEVQPESLTLRVTTTMKWEVGTTHDKYSANGIELVMSMFLSLYQVLNLSRAIQKSGGG